MKIFGFIPARGGSKGVPKKNIYLLNGRPLIAYTIIEGLKSKISRLIVSTDSSEIANIAREYGGDVPFLRPDNLAQDDSIIEEAIVDTLKRLKENESYEPEIIVLLHPTTPLRTASHINDSINLLLETQADSVVSVSPPMEQPGDMVYWDSSGKMHFLLETLIEPFKAQRQGYPECYFLNGVVYTFTYRSFLETGDRFGKRSVPYMMRQIDSIDIDSMDDMLIAEAIIRQRDKTLKT